MRELSFDEIRAATLGAARVCVRDGAVRFYRFTEEEEDFYRFRLDNFYHKTFATAGVKLSFRTDSRTLSLSCHVERGANTRTFFSLDVTVDGTPVGYLDNFSHAPLPDGYYEEPFALGDFSGSFALGEGEKSVTVHLPWSMCLSLSSLAIDEGASLAPLCPGKLLLAYGDSITHGYDATRPHLRQIARLADALGAEEYNKAIGGEVFCPGLAACACPLAPDYITVAYGTNDWGKTDYDTFVGNCTAFYRTLSARHPDARIFAITPIARGGAKTNATFGHFDRVAEKIREVAGALSNVTVIEGGDLVPADPRY